LNINVEKDWPQSVKDKLSCDLLAH